MLASLRSSLVLFAIAAFTAIPAVVRGDVMITSPVAGTTWTAGQPVTITWTAAPGTTLDNTKTQQIQVLQGNPSALQLVGVAGTVNQAAQTFTFIPPADWVNGNNMVVRIGNKYSHQFGFQGGVASPTAGTVAPTATASPTATQTAPTSTQTSLTTPTPLPLNHSNITNHTKNFTQNLTLPQLNSNPFMNNAERHTTSLAMVVSMAALSSCVWV